jgi:Zn-dependent protease
VLLGEPSRTPYDLNFTLFGIPVRVHPFFWLAGLLLGPKGGGPPAILFWMLAFLVGILCHELGHALLMRRYGEFSWITLYGFGGLASSDRRQSGWGGSSDAWRQIFISAAGPFAGFALAAVAAIMALLAGCELKYMVGLPFGILPMIVSVPEALDNRFVVTLISFFVNSLFVVTVVYGILNLLPIYPLDGGQIARELLVMALGRDGVRHSIILSLFVSISLALACILFWHEPFMAIFFAFFAYSSFAMLQGYGGGSPW